MVCQYVVDVACVWLVNMQYIGSASTGKGSSSDTQWSADLVNDSTHIVSRLRMTLVFVDQLWCLSLIGNNPNRVTN